MLEWRELVDSHVNRQGSSLQQSLHTLGKSGTWCFARHDLPICQMSVPAIDHRPDY